MVRNKPRRRNKKPSQGADTQQTVSEETLAAVPDSSQSNQSSRPPDDSVGASEPVAAVTSPPSPTTPVTSPKTQRSQDGEKIQGEASITDSTRPTEGVDEKVAPQEKSNDENVQNMAAATGGITNGSDVSLNKLAELQEEYENVVLERDSLRKLMVIKDEAVKQAEGDRMMVSEKYIVVEAERNALYMENKNLSKQLECMDAEAKELKGQIAGLENELMEFRAQNLELAMRLSKLNEEKGNYEKQAESLKQSSSTSESTIQDLTEKLRIVQAERDSVKVRLAECQADMWKLEEEGKQARAEVQALRDGPRAEMEDMEVEIQDLTNQLCSTEFLLEDSKVKKSKMEDMMTRLQRSRIESMVLAGLGGAVVSATIIGGVCLLLSRKKS